LVLREEDIEDIACICDASVASMAEGRGTDNKPSEYAMLQDRSAEQPEFQSISCSPKQLPFDVIVPSSSAHSSLLLLHVLVSEGHAAT